MPIEIIYEDAYILVVNKPNNVVVHHSYHSRNVVEETSLLQLLNGVKAYPIHRLDRRTSGIIMLAKETAFVSKFQALFTTNNITKTYYGVVRGFAPTKKSIDSPVKGKDAKAYKVALTELKTLVNITLDVPVKPYDSSRYSLVELQPKTGRMHQLRIHCKKISHPLIGDIKYGDKSHNTMFVEHFGWSNLFLHAGCLSFTHPFTEENLFLKANFPKDWHVLFEKFNWLQPI